MALEQTAEILISKFLLLQTESNLTSPLAHVYRLPEKHKFIKILLLVVNCND